MGQKKVMLLRNQLLNEEQRSAEEKDLRLEDLEDVKFDTWYVNMNKNVDRKEKDLRLKDLEDVKFDTWY